MKMNEKEPVGPEHFVNEELVLCYTTLKHSKIIHSQDHRFCYYDHEKKDCAQPKSTQHLINTCFKISRHCESALLFAFAVHYLSLYIFADISRAFQSQ